MSKDFESNHKYVNWAETIKFSPERYCKPSTYAELADALEQSAALKRRVRVGATGHSWTPGMVPGAAEYKQGKTADGDMIDVSGLSPENARLDPGLKAVYFEHAGHSYVAIPPGMTQGELLVDAHHHGKAVSTAGPAPTISMGGFVSNGGHSANWNDPIPSDTVHAIEIMSIDANGKAVRTVYVHDEELLSVLYEKGIVGRDALVSTEIDAARVSVGMLGIITKLVIEVENDYRFRVLDEYVEEDFLFPDGDNPNLSNLEELVTSSDYAMIFWFSLNNYINKDKRQTNELWVKRFKRTDEDTRAVLKVIGMTHVVGNLAKVFGGKPGAVIERNPGRAPLKLRAAWEFIKMMMYRRVKHPNFKADFEHPGRRPPIVHSKDAFLFQEKYFENFIDFAYSFPIPKRPDGGYDFSNVREAYQAATKKVYELADRNHYPISITIAMRFLNSTSTLLSLARQADSSTRTCVIECITYREQGPRIAEFAAAIAPLWFSLGGRPHLGKKLDELPGAFEDAYKKLSMYGDLERFEKVRKRVDPNGMFQNDFVHRLRTGAPALPPEYAPSGGEPGGSDDPDTVIASKALNVSFAIRGDEDGFISDGKCVLKHEGGETGEARLIDENNEGHRFYYRDLGTNQRIYDLISKPEKLSVEEVFKRIEDIYTSTVFTCEADARAAVVGARNYDNHKVANPILIHNATGHRIRLAHSISWEGEFDLLQPAKELDPTNWAATFHPEIKGGSKGCLVYSVLNDDDTPICDVFMGFSSLRGLFESNKIYVEVREPGHWFVVGTENHMKDLVGTAGKKKSSNSNSYGGVQITVNAEIVKGNEPMTVFTLS
jgi:FAD/FMN-containing dehydrogenase